VQALEEPGLWAISARRGCTQRPIIRSQRHSAGLDEISSLFPAGNLAARVPVSTFFAQPPPKFRIRYMACPSPVSIVSNLGRPGRGREADVAVRASGRWAPNL
jgi:hypothetical protein